jgi:hypothetical protein
MLMQLLARAPALDWKTVAELLGNRTARQCRERYHNYLAPDVANVGWTKAEEKLLREKYHDLGPHWAKMKDCFPGKSPVNIKNKWAKMTGTTRPPEIEPQEPEDSPPPVQPKNLFLDSEGLLDLDEFFF